jgi:secondary thiamine-phosphate synthase enzyme
MLAKITVKTPQRITLVDITDKLQTVVQKNNVQDGILHVYCPHTTAAITVNENADPSVREDITNTLNQLIPHHANYQHTEGNADAHIKASLIGSSQVLFVENGIIALGTWQGVYFCEFDGPRTREVWVKVFLSRS